MPAMGGGGGEGEGGGRGKGYEMKREIFPSIAQYLVGIA